MPYSLMTMQRKWKRKQAWGDAMNTIGCVTILASIILKSFFGELLINQ